MSMESSLFMKSFPGSDKLPTYLFSNVTYSAFIYKLKNFYRQTTDNFLYNTSYSGQTAIVLFIQVQ